MKYGFQTGDDGFSRILRVVQYLGKRDMLACLVLLLAVLGQLPWALPLFGVGATLVLLPATVKANLPPLRRTLRPSVSVDMG